MNYRPYLWITILCLAGCGDSSTLPPNGSTANSKDHAGGLYAFEDFSFSIPAGWTVVKPDRDKTMAMLLLGGTNWQNAKAMIKVDVGTPSAPTAKQLAEGFAKNTNGTSSADPLDFDGTPGFSASTASTELSMPRNMMVVYRDGQAYLLMVGALEGVEVGDVISHVRKSWKWTEPNAG